MISGSPPARGWRGDGAPAGSGPWQSSGFL